jgi:sugar O-acyltransferase (sialic acid O-acetyltransferase NeuD family)
VSTHAASRYDSAATIVGGDGIVGSDGRLRLVIFGASNILSDLFDCALANGLLPAKVVIHLPEESDERSIPVAQRVARLAPLCPPPAIEQLDEFRPASGEAYLLGPTTPARAALAAEVQRRFGLAFHTLVHPTAYVSPLATLGSGTFVGARSAVAAGAMLGEHVFVNRGATIGHDTRIGAFSRIQPGSAVGGLSTIGRGVTVGIGATLIERLSIGDNAVIGAGSTVVKDVPENVVVFGSPATIRKPVAHPVFGPDTAVSV